MSTGMPFNAKNGDLKIGELVFGKMYVPRDAYMGHSVIVVGHDGVAGDQNGKEPNNSPYRVLEFGDAKKLALGLRRGAERGNHLANFIEANLS